MAVTPPPIIDNMNSQRWLEWFRKISLEIDAISTVTWSVIDFTGSDLADIATKPHNILDSIQGGAANEYYHLTASEYNDLQNNDTSRRYSLLVGGS